MSIIGYSSYIVHSLLTNYIGIQLVRLGLNYSERTRELGPEGPQLAGASSYSSGCQQGEAKNLMFTVLD